MTDAVEVAIEHALLDRLNAMVLSPAVPIAEPNETFTPPAMGQNAVWLRASFLPANTAELTVDYEGNNQHYGIFQVDVFYGQGAGELAPARIAASIIAWFKRGTKLSRDGFTVQITKPPRRGNMVLDGNWQQIPVSIPYLTFAVNP